MLNGRKIIISDLELNHVQFKTSLGSIEESDVHLFLQALKLP